MEEQRLSFEVMLCYLYRVLEGVEDSRQRSNAQPYSLPDLVLGAFSVFYMQCPSACIAVNRWVKLSLPRAII